MSLEPAPLAADEAWLQEAIMAGSPPPGESIKERLAGSAAFPAAAGLAVYRRAYIARIAAAMRAQFPALCHALGEALFNDFAADYVRLHPPESYTLHDLGRRFPAFVDEQRPDRADHPAEREVWIDFMVDLARFERTLFGLYDAPGAEDGAMAQPATPDERLRLQPAVALGRYGFEVAAYYHAVRRNEAPSLPARGPHFVALVRTGYAIQTIALAEPEFHFLEAMIDGGSVSDGLAGVAAATGIPVLEATSAWHAAPQTRARWIRWGLFVETSGI